MKCPCLSVTVKIRFTSLTGTRIVSAGLRVVVPDAASPEFLVESAGAVAVGAGAVAFLGASTSDAGSNDWSDSLFGFSSPALLDAAGFLAPEFGAGAAGAGVGAGFAGLAGVAF